PRGRAQRGRGAAPPVVRRAGGRARPAHAAHGDGGADGRRAAPGALRRPGLGSVSDRLRASGPTLREAFAEAALAVIARAADPASVEEREVREVRAPGASVQSLAANWINECLYVHEVEGFAWRRIEFAVFEAEARAGGEPMRLHGFLHGEAIDEAADDVTAVVSAGAVSVSATDAGYEIQVDL